MIKRSIGKVIKDVCRFLDGKYEDLIDDLRKQMEKAAAELNFEKAAILRDKIGFCGKGNGKAEDHIHRPFRSGCYCHCVRERESVVQIFLLEVEN